MPPSPSPVIALLDALCFAAWKHRDQQRKGVDAAPYINHPIEVAELLARVGGVTDAAVLQAAALHDTVEDTATTPEEIEARFGAEVRRLVEEMTDPPGVPKAEQKRLQEEHAPHLSAGAKQIKIADKISNVRAIAYWPPADWPLARKRAYLDWTERVIAGCRGANPALERRYDEVLRDARARLAGEGEGDG